MKSLYYTCLFSLVTCFAVQAEDSNAEQLAAGFIAEIETLRTEAHIPGLSVAVVKDGSVLLATGLGYSNINDKIPATADTPYDIASVAKPISAVVALRLVELGMLDLDQPMVEYCDWDRFCEAFSKQPSIFAREIQCEPPLHNLRQLLSHTATREPGTYFSYNPVLYSWASRPMMAQTGESFSSMVAKYVFQPAEMRDSARKNRDLPLPVELNRQQAQPYQIDNYGVASPAQASKGQGDGAAGGVVSTVSDLAKFDIALDRGELISLASREQMFQPTLSPDGENFDYAIGWFVQEHEGIPLAWHSGWWEDAYSALYLKVLDQNLSFIILANSEGIWWDNPPEKAEVERSQFAQAFLQTFVFAQVD